MADFPLRLEYNAGLENAPGDPFGRTELVVEANGSARLVHKHVGLARTWTGQVDVATLQTAWAALERGGFPEIPQHPVPGGSAMRTIIEAARLHRRVSDPRLDRASAQRRHGEGRAEYAAAGRHEHRAPD
jgi:hypothetical protein